MVVLVIAPELEHQVSFNDIWAYDHLPLKIKHNFSSDVTVYKYTERLCQRWYDISDQREAKVVRNDVVVYLFENGIPNFWAPECRTVDHGNVLRGS